MFTLTKKSILALFIAILPIVSICSNNSPSTQNIKNTVLEYVPTVKSFCNTLSEKCESLYNPLSILAVSVTSAALGLRNIGFLLVGGIVVAHADQISEYVKDFTGSFEKSVQAPDKPVENKKESHIQV